MSLLKKIITVLRLPVKDKMFAIRVFWLLHWVKLKLKFVPFKEFAGELGESGKETPVEPMPERHAEFNKIHLYIEGIAKYSPFKIVCLPQALVAKKLLNEKQIPATIYFGIKKETKDEAHAWVRVGCKFVTGKTDFSQFALVASFV